MDPQFQQEPPVLRGERRFLLGLGLDVSVDVGVLGADCGVTMEISSAEGPCFAGADCGVTGVRTG